VAQREDSLALAATLHRLAVQHGVDAILMAGDVFDSASQPDAFADDIAEELSACSVPVIAIPGNHDIQYSPYDGDPFGRLFRNLIGAAQSLVHEDGEELTLADGRLRVWGRGMPEHTPENDPLSRLPHFEENGAWRVALAHGYLLDTPNGRSSPIMPARHHDALATFDYLALGHRHLPTQTTYGDTLITDPGSASSTAGHRTYAIVDFADGIVTSTIQDLSLTPRERAAHVHDGRHADH